MKKLVCVCIVLMLMTCSCLAEHVHEEENAGLISAGYNGLWYAEDKQLRWIPDGDIEGKVVYTAAHAILGLAGVREGVYLLMPNEAELTVYFFSKEEGRANEVFSIDHGTVRTMLATDDGILVLYEATEEQQMQFVLDGELVYYSYTGSKMELPINQAFSMTMNEQNVLTVVNYSQNGFSASSIDLDTMNMETVMQRSVLSAIALANNGYCFTTESNLLYMDEEGNSTQLLDIAASYTLPPMLASVNQCIYLLDQQGLQYININELASAVLSNDTAKLTIVNCMGIEDYRLAAAIRSFEAETGVKIVMTEVNQQQLLTKLMAGEDSIDILFVDSSMLRQFYEAGVLGSLNEYSQLQDSLDTWMDVLSVSTFDGELVAVPAYISAANIYVDTSLEQFFSAELPKECTWIELFDLAEQFQADTNGDGYDDAYYMMDNMYYPEFVRQYVSAYADEGCDFANPYFVRMMESYKTLVQKGYIGDLYNPEHTKGTLFFVDRTFGAHIYASLNMPLLEDGTPYVVGFVHGMGISEFSPNKDLAAAFLAAYASQSNQVSPDGIGLLKDTSLNPYVVELTDSEKQLMEASIEQFELVAPLWQYDDFTLALMENIDLYLTDRISIDELVKRLNQKMAMVQQG